MKYLILLSIIFLSSVSNSQGIQAKRFVKTDTSFNNEALIFVNKFGDIAQVSVNKISGILKGVVNVERFTGRKWEVVESRTIVDTKDQVFHFSMVAEDRIAYRPEGVQASVLKVIIKNF